jgi:hypothetical protein
MQVIGASLWIVIALVIARAGKELQRYEIDDKDCGF